jgi:predicted N-acetyltransferase YhbS
MSQTPTSNLEPIRPLQKSDDRKSFDCGQEDLNLFIRQFARQKQERDEQKTYVICEGSRILAFITLAIGESQHNGRAVPVLRLLRLATDKSAQKQGLGLALTLYAFRMAVGLAQLAGCTGILVDAKSASINFYAKLGFEPLDEVEGAIPLPMFLDIKVIRQVLAQ